MSQIHSKTKSHPLVDSSPDVADGIHRLIKRICVQSTRSKSHTKILQSRLNEKYEQSLAQRATLLTQDIIKKAIQYAEARIGQESKHLDILTQKQSDLNQKSIESDVRSKTTIRIEQCDIENALSALNMSQFKPKNDTNKHYAAKRQDKSSNRQLDSIFYDKR